MPRWFARFPAALALLGASHFAAAQEPATSKPAVRAAPSESKWRYFISEANATKLFTLLSSPGTRETDEYDPWLYFRHRPNLDAQRHDEELPNKDWRMRTNSLGLRMDNELEEGSPEVGILLTGDANAEGVCNNSETIATRLEQKLRLRHPAERVEVVNAGKGSYCFYNYLGVLERFADRRPKVFVVLVCWNDFEESLHIYHHFAHTAMPNLDAQTWKHINAAVKIHENCLSQGMLAYTYFKRFPDELELAQANAALLLGEIAAKCAAYGIQPMIVWCPPPFDLSDPEPIPGFERVLKELELTRDDLKMSVRASERLLDSALGLRAVTLDLRKAFETQKGAVYFKIDDHLSLTGNEIVARELAPIVDLLVQPPPAKH